MEKINLRLLASNNYRIYNYEIAKKIGIKEAILLADIISKHIYFEENNMLTEDNYFFSTADDIFQTTALTRKEQERCIKELLERDLIKTKLTGIPAKKHFKLSNNIQDLFFISDNKLSENKKTSFNKKGNQVLTKSENKVLQKVKTYNNINNNINNNNIIIKEKTEKFVKLVEVACKGVTLNEYQKRIIDDFILYWTEPTKSERQIKYDKEATWDTKRRLRTWFRNADKFGGNKQSNKRKII